MTVTNTVFTVFSGIGLTLSVIPLWWHLGSRNVGTCMYAVWTALACLVQLVNSVMWDGNTVNRAPVWCDIAIRIQIAVTVAWPACGLCIIRSLYLATSKTIQIEKRREVFINVMITVGIPVLEMAAEYIIALRRFAIYEDYGCQSMSLNTPLGYVLFLSWPLIIGVVSACYGALIICAFMKRRREFKDLIAANINLTYSRYWRLMALASMDFCFTIPLATWGIVQSAFLDGVEPWVSWADTHFDYSQVPQYPRAELSLLGIWGLELSRWSAILCAFVFFGFFGLSSEAKKNYRILASAVGKYLRIPAFAGDVATPDPHVQSRLSFASAPASFPSTTQLATFPRPSSVFPPIEEVVRVLDATPDPASVRRASTPVAPIPAPVDNTEKV